MYLIYLNNQEPKQGTKAYLTKCANGDELGVTQFIQSSIPANYPYWKIEGGKLVEMSQSEKDYYDTMQEYLRIEREEFKGFDYRIETTLDYAVSNENIQPREITRILTDKNTEKISREVEGVDMLFLYFNTPRSKDAELLSDPNINFFALSSYYPNI